MVGALIAPEDLETFYTVIVETADISFSTASYRETVVPGSARTLLGRAEEDRIMEIWLRRNCPTRVQPIVACLRTMARVRRLAAPGTFT
jgi:hypothetical protein